MTRKFVLASVAALAFLAAPAFAADMAVKAPPVSPFQTYNGSGFYWGFGTASRLADASANANILAANLVSGNTLAAGQALDFEVGYIWGNVGTIAGFANWARFYADGSYQNVAGGVSGPGGSVSSVSRWSAQQGFDVNADIVSYVMSIFNWKNPFPGFAPPTLSNVSVAATAHQYVGGFVVEQGLGGNVGAATGSSVALAYGARTGWLWQLLNAAGKPNGMGLDTGFQVAWMPRGITLNNVFASNGAPLVTNPSMNMGTTYSAYLHVLFPSLL